jgi:hypothetical protein
MSTPTVEHSLQRTLASAAQTEILLGHLPGELAKRLQELTAANPPPAFWRVELRISAQAATRMPGGLRAIYLHVGNTDALTITTAKQYFEGLFRRAMATV